MFYDFLNKFPILVKKNTFKTKISLTLDGYMERVKGYGFNILIGAIIKLN